MATDLSSLSPSASTQSSSAEEAQAIAQEAYVYLYPLISMDVTRKQLINLDPKVSHFGGPANAFTHVRGFPTAEMRTVVGPNFDTLYSSAWLDLTNGPLVVSTSDTGGAISCCRCSICGRMYLPYQGNGQTAQWRPHFALVAPGWSGNLPQDVERIAAPTPYVWVIGRTQTNGVKDYDAVHKVQDGYTITLLAD